MTPCDGAVGPGRSRPDPARAVPVREERAPAAAFSRSLTRP